MKIGISSLLFNLEEAIEICKNEKIINHIEVGIDNIEECNTLLKYKEIFKQSQPQCGYNSAQHR